MREFGFVLYNFVHQNYNVDKIRKALAPEIGAKAAGLDKEAAEVIEAEQEAENRRKEAEEAERRKAVEHERLFRSLPLPLEVLGQHDKGVNCVYYNDYDSMYDLTLIRRAL